MRTILVLAVALTASAPAIAGAQTTTERRQAQVYDNLRQLEQSQRIGDLQSQVTALEIRRQSEAALRALQSPRQPAPTFVVGSSAAIDVPALQSLRTPAERQQEKDQGVRAVADQLANLELKLQADETLRALQAPPRVRPAPIVVPGSTAARRAPTIQRAPTPDSAAAVAAAEANRARDQELAASNARLREIAQAQRSN